MLVACLMEELHLSATEKPGPQHQPPGERAGGSASPSPLSLREDSGSGWSTPRTLLLVARSPGRSDGAAGRQGQVEGVASVGASSSVQGLGRSLDQPCHSTGRYSWTLGLGFPGLTSVLP